MSHFDPQTPEEIAARLSDIRTKLATRTNRDGSVDQPKRPHYTVRNY